MLLLFVLLALCSGISKNLWLLCFVKCLLVEEKVVFCSSWCVHSERLRIETLLCLLFVPLLGGSGLDRRNKRGHIPEYPWLERGMFLSCQLEIDYFNNCKEEDLFSDKPYCYFFTMSTCANLNKRVSLQCLFLNYYFKLGFSCSFFGTSRSSEFTSFLQPQWKWNNLYEGYK